MKRIARALASRLPFVRGLLEQVSRQGLYPAGHYYSPIPSRDDVRAYVERLAPPAADVPGIDMNRDGQLRLLEEFAAFYDELPFPEQPDPAHRYHYRNDWFSYSDAIFLHCFLRRFTPRRIVEVGSGFSSAVMLDTADGLPGWTPELVFVEPYPERLNSLLRPADAGRVRLLEHGVQQAPAAVFEALEAGDLLFIDSSHVVKCGSDLQHLMFEVLPRLRPGVFVHFHDVFHPFEYPANWLLEGRCWNENYFLRAFLSYNAEWRIRFFNTWVHQQFGELIERRMPLCTRNPGGSLYIQRLPEADAAA